MEMIEFEDFLKVELRVGKIVSAEEFKEAKTCLYVVCKTSKTHPKSLS
jgi:tRNA-binding EMAP/Myf-like protein